jgi:hypothetical protein
VSAKVVTTDTVLRVTAGVFEVTGSRATAKKVGLDRFWRDIRTHSLHDPVAYKNRELGEYVLLDKVNVIPGSLIESRLISDYFRCLGLRGIHEGISNRPIKSHGSDLSERIYTSAFVFGERHSSEVLLKN